VSAFHQFSIVYSFPKDLKLSDMPPVLEHGYPGSIS